MRKYYRSIIFTKTPLKSQFRYKDSFQILPIDSKNAPKSPYNEHFPLFLEYQIDFDKDSYSKKLDIIERISAQRVAEFEIINLLTVLSNHRFFRYQLNNNQWATMTPNIGFDNLSEKQTELYNNQFSSWTIRGYLYPGLRRDLQIVNFNERAFPKTRLISPYYDYFLKDPVENKKGEILFPETINCCLDNYYSLPAKTLRNVKSSIALICDGIDIADFKRSLAFLSFVSAIESFVGLEFPDKSIEFECNSCKTIRKSPYVCPECNEPIWGIKTKFREFLKKFVAGGNNSITKYNKIYNLRSRIVHQGQLLLSDYDLSMDYMEKKENNWLMKLETLQLARISLTNWLRYSKKYSR